MESKQQEYFKKINIEFEKNRKNETIHSIEQLPLAGSQRIYFRVSSNENTYIATISDNIIENIQFIEWANLFYKNNIPVPKIYFFNEDKSIYFQEDVGVNTLLEKKLLLGECDEVKKNYQDALLHLIDIQFIFQAKEFEIEFKKLNAFDEERIKYDLNYFKTYFLLQTGIQLNEHKLENEFDDISKSILNKNLIVFMYRDFQGRNIMVKNNKVYFIDFQGAMQGSPMYDVASLLWQAKAALSKKWKNELLDFYIFHLSNRVKIDVNEIKKNYQKIVLIRLLQVMGAYGLRGIVEKKEHFLSSIPNGIKNINEWMSENSLEQYPELHQCLKQLKNYKN